MQTVIAPRIRDLGDVLAKVHAERNIALTIAITGRSGRRLRAAGFRRDGGQPDGERVQMGARADRHPRDAGSGHDAAGDRGRRSGPAAGADRNSLAARRAAG